MKTLILGSLSLLILANCSEPQQTDSRQDDYPSPVVVQADAGKGLDVFLAKCALCHGKSGKGSNQGPPLVHNIYRPDHHSDYSVERAVKFGVQSHHWGFGNMPPIPGLSQEDIKHLVAYIRKEQNKAGIQ
ncbi:cytochrome c [Mariprofundus micogutta]|uniref:Cytochrome c n=1 Tax=Mariprofundus micogutta TaxID=1921010 RepID=A0A1L8CNX4_9PROT|nr:cytochrome c [Mariprofundus micogutta]GAV20620.1 cytochrome c [Mariprofundus micogutta]